MSNTIVKPKKRKTETLSVVNAQKLDKIARDIRSSYDSANGLAKLARNKGREAVAEAILCGNYLNEAKQIIGHGGFLKWLAKHCKAVDRETARRWMLLAKNCHNSNLGNSNNLRQAYVAIGILPETVAPQLRIADNQTAQPPTPSPVEHSVIDAEVIPAETKPKVVSDPTRITRREALTQKADALIIVLKDYIREKLMNKADVELFFRELLAKI